MISENLSGTQKFTAKASSINIPLQIGTTVLANHWNFYPIIKAGVNLYLTLNFDTERTDILTKEDFENLNLTYNISGGVRFNRTEILLSYHRDINKYIKPIDNKNSYLSLKIGYSFFQR